MARFSYCFTRTHWFARYVRNHDAYLGFWIAGDGFALNVFGRTIWLIRNA